MTNVDRVLEAVMQADRLWQQAVKQLNNNQLEGILLVDVLYSIYGVVTETVFRLTNVCAQNPPGIGMTVTSTTYLILFWFTAK